MSAKSRLIALGVLTGAVLLGGAALVALGNNEARDEANEERAKLRASIARYDARFVADQKLVASSSIVPIVLPSTRSQRDEHDAGAFLASKMPTVTNDVATPSAIPAAIAGAIDTQGFARFLDKHGTASVDVERVDTSWMKELARFDAWNLDALPEVKAARPVDVRDMPIPRLRDAPLWAAIRALQAIDDGDFAHAGPELDDVARLLVSTETWIGSVHAASVLRIERNAYDYAVAHPQKGVVIDVGAWTPPDMAAVQAFARASRAVLAYVAPHDDAATIDKLASSDLLVGRCHAIGSAATTLIALEPIVGDLYGDVHGAIGRALSSSPCRLQLVREAWDHPEQRALAAGVDALCVLTDGDCVAVSIAAHVPGAAHGFFDAMYGHDHDDELDTVYAHAP